METTYVLWPQIQVPLTRLLSEVPLFQLSRAKTSTKDNVTSCYNESGRGLHIINTNDYTAHARGSDKSSLKP